MKSVRRTSQFKKDVKRQQKRGCDFTTFRRIIIDLADGKSLDSKYRDHALSGSFQGCRECHVEPDWL